MKKTGELSNILILILVGVFLMGTAFLTASETDNMKEHGIELNEGWKVTVNGVPCQETTIDTIAFPLVNRGDEVIMETILPDTVIPNPVFVFYSVHSAMRVSLENKEIFAYALERYEKGKMAGYGYQSVNLPEDYSGKKLTVQLLVCEDLAFSTFDMPKLYDANWYVKDYLMENRVPLIINLFLIVFGICMAVTTLVLLVRMRSMQWMRLFWVSLFSLGIGCWSLCNYNLTYMFTNSLLWKTLMEYAALYTVPIPVFAYFYDEVMSAEGKLRHFAYAAIMAAQSVFTLTAYVLQISGICHFPKILYIQHLLMVVIALYLLYLFSSDIYHKRLGSVVLFSGAVILILFAAVDLLRFNFEKYINVTAGGKYVGSLSIGVMIFITSMLLDFSRNIIHTLLEAARGKTLEELAYTDALTGLANKRSCEETFDTLDAQEEKQYAIGVFDLNNLKKVNDGLGHEEGDAFIRSFGEILKEVFAKGGLVSRTGGDEFTVILYSAAGEEIAARIEKMEELLQKKNQENTAWNLSTAYGFCEYREKPGLSAKQLYKIADGRMYDCKKKMKQEGVAVR